MKARVVASASELLAAASDSTIAAIAVNDNLTGLPTFRLQLMRAMRRHILEGTWLEFYHLQRDVLDARDSYGKPPRHVTNAQRRTAKMKRSRYEIVVRDDVGRIRDCVSGETMHSVNEPAEEARSLYVEQSRQHKSYPPPAGRCC